MKQAQSDAKRRYRVTRDAADDPAFLPTQADEEELIWHESSYELRRGMEMSEEPLETLPGELRELFPKD